MWEISELPLGSLDVLIDKVSNMPQFYGPWRNLGSKGLNGNH